MSKGFATLGTLIRLCSRVNSLMLCKVYVLVEGSPTFITLVGFFLVVDSHMLSEMGV